MKDEAKVKNAKRRMEEYEEKQKKARGSYNFQDGGASSSQGPQKRKGGDIEECSTSHDSEFTEGRALIVKPRKFFGGSRRNGLQAKPDH